MRHWEKMVGYSFESISPGLLVLSGDKEDCIPFSGWYDMKVHIKIFAPGFFLAFITIVH